MTLLTRYFISDILKMTWTITAVLCFVFLAYLFKGYLNQLSLGLLTPYTLLQLTVLHLPLLLATVLPLGLYLGSLITYRQLDTYNERLAAMANGLSYARFTGIAVISAAGVILIVSVIMLWLKPHLYWAEKQLVTHQTDLSKAIKTGQFLLLQNGKSVIYTDHIDSQGNLHQVFLAHQPNTASKTTLSKMPWQVITARKAYISKHPPTGQTMIFENGHRYKVLPGSKTTERVAYKHYDQRLPEALTPAKHPHLSVSQQVKYLPTYQLWSKTAHNRWALAELQWRLSLPVSVLILTLLAVPLSQPGHQKNKSLLLILAILLYIGYIDILLLGRAWMKKGLLTGPGLWWIHGGMVCLLLGFYSPYFKRWLKGACL